MFHIIADVLDQYEGDGDDLWGYMHDTFSKEKGLETYNVEAYTNVSSQEEFRKVFEYRRKEILL